MEKIQNEKENVNIKRVQRTKKDQFDLIVNFFKVNNESLMESDLFHKKWSELVVKLNSVGPPIHSCSEWRRVWSDRKYNNKRKRSILEGSSESTKKPLIVPTAQHVYLGEFPNEESNLSSTTDLNYYNNSSLCGSIEKTVSLQLGDLNDYFGGESSFNNNYVLFGQVKETNVFKENTIETSNKISDQSWADSGVEPIQSTHCTQTNLLDENTSLLGDLNYYIIPNIMGSTDNSQFNETTIDTSNRTSIQSTDDSGQSIADSGQSIADSGQSIADSGQSTAESGQSNTDSGYIPIEISQQTQSHLNAEISSKLSDLLKRLDVIICNQIETISLLKELVKPS